jgi:SAM-dependent methyltransferase
MQYNVPKQNCRYKSGTFSMASSFNPRAMQQQYGTQANLQTRIDIHERYTTPRVDFPAWVLDRVTWKGDERVLDVGSGAGTYLPALQQVCANVRYVGSDLSLGMLAAHRAGLSGTLVDSDAQALPFAPASFDVVMANHMLYHVPNIPAAIAECKRVLAPNGLLIAATNSTQNMPEFAALFRRALMLLMPPGALVNVPPLPSAAFALENGSQMLARYFRAVVRYDLPQVMIFDSVDPALSYLNSSRSMREPTLPRGVVWEDLIAIMREQLSRVLNHFGELVVNKLTGVLIATDSGGFISQYAALRGDAKG